MIALIGACFLGLLWNLLVVALIAGAIAFACWLISLVIRQPIPDVTQNQWVRIVLVLVALILFVQFVLCVLGAAPPSFFGKPWGVR